MKKIIRLTESDLTRIIKRILREQEETSDIKIYVYDNPDAKRGDRTITTLYDPITISKHEKRGDFIDLTTDGGLKLTYACNDIGRIVIPGYSNKYGEKFFLDEESINKLTELCQTYGKSKNETDDEMGDEKIEESRIRKYRRY
jgi:hypothetical protein